MAVLSNARSCSLKEDMLTSSTRFVGFHTSKNAAVEGLEVILSRGKIHL
jgi:hypothetical protein